MYELNLSSVDKGNPEAAKVLGEQCFRLQYLACTKFVPCVDFLNLHFLFFIHPTATGKSASISLDQGSTWQRASFSVKRVVRATGPQAPLHLT